MLRGPREKEKKALERQKLRAVETEAGRLCEKSGGEGILDGGLSSSKSSAMLLKCSKGCRKLGPRVCPMQKQWEVFLFTKARFGEGSRW